MPDSKILETLVRPSSPVARVLADAYTAARSDLIKEGPPPATRAVTQEIDELVQQAATLARLLPEEDRGYGPIRKRCEQRDSLFQR